MALLSQLLAVLSVLSLLILCNQLTKHTKNKKQNIKSPPEPPGSWPIIGHLHLLTGQTIPANRILGSLADNHGPVFTLRLGLQPAVVVSSCEAVKQCFTQNDKVLVNRPDSNAGRHLGFDYAAFGFTNGPYWRQMRKLVMLELVSGPRLQMLRPVRISEIDTSIKELYEVLLGFYFPKYIKAGILCDESYYLL